MDISAPPASTPATDDIGGRKPHGGFLAEPAAALLARVRQELAAEFAPSRPIRLSRAPGRLDVMGGIAQYTGSWVCQYPLDCGAAVALQERDDRRLQIFSFNLLDEHKPFTFGIPLDALASCGAQELRREFNEPGRKWAAYIAGCLYALHLEKLIDLHSPAARGLNLVTYNNIPQAVGLGSRAAIEVATMISLVDHFGVRDRLVAGKKDSTTVVESLQAATPLRIAELCQRAENQIAGVLPGRIDQVTSCLGEQGDLLKILCQPHEVQGTLQLPAGVRVLGINSNVQHKANSPAYTRARCAAFMGHRVILEAMQAIGTEAGRELTSDPMRGYLANLDPDDYKNIFRPGIPESVSGREFLDRFGAVPDPATALYPATAPEPGMKYPIRHAADHHVLEARRVRRFVEFLEQSHSLTGAKRKSALNRAGHLMYASHQSYMMDAMLGAPGCDLLVRLVRDREPHGLHGARITGGGEGGTVAILADMTAGADAAIDQIMVEYEKQTGHKPQALSDSSRGAWHVGTRIVRG